MNTYEYRGVQIPPDETVSEEHARIAKELRESILTRVERFVEETMRRDPKLNDGEHGELRIRVGRLGYDETDREVWDVRFTEEYEG